jgi:hypothetical protein
MNQQMQEEFRDIIDYEGIYTVSNFGRIYSVKRGIIMKPIKNNRGYIFINLFKNNCKKTCQIHRLIARAFLTDYSEDLDVDHIDRSKTNNHLSNLRMTTRAQNITNTKPRNKTGYKGICLTKSGKYRVQIQVNNKYKYVGTYSTLEDAVLYRNNYIDEFCPEIKPYYYFGYHSSSEEESSSDSSSSELNLL